MVAHTHALIIHSLIHSLTHSLAHSLTPAQVLELDYTPFQYAGLSGERELIVCGGDKVRFE